MILIQRSLLYQDKKIGAAMAPIKGEVYEKIIYINRLLASFDVLIITFICVVSMEC